MKLRKLEIVGFKSFVERTILKFDHDVTGVVGPNGCGKSNIVDAIRWCMGEQSAKHLRGKSMDDVIFNGSESRGPHGFAEVTLTFDNSDGEGPVEYRDYAELAITRRLDREGNSDYLINKTQVRLKDVTDLFLGTGAGTKAYSIVEQGKVGLIVSSKAEDRRMLIEEAAGITKYKSKRKQAERKMELTQQNLLRVGDIVAELEKSLASLQRQAQKADRYLRYRNELDDLVLHEAAHKYLGIVALQKHFDAALDEWTLAASEKKSALVAREAELETLRLAALETESKLEAAHTAHFAAENEVRALEAEIARAKDQLEAIRAREVDATRELQGIAHERGQLAGEQERHARELDLQKAEEAAANEALTVEEGRLTEATERHREIDRRLQELRRSSAQLGARIASAESALKGFERRRADIEQRTQKLVAEKESLELHVVEQNARREALHWQTEDLRAGKNTALERRAELEEKLGVLKRDVIESERQLDHHKHALHQARSRMHALLEVQSRMEGVGAGVRAIVQQRDPGVLGMLADLVEPPPELTQALAAALAEDLTTLVVVDEEKAIALARWLRDEKKGRAVFLPRTGKHLGAACTRLPEEMLTPRGLPEQPALHASDALGYMADLVKFRAEDEEIVRAVLGDVVVARDFEAAHRIAAHVQPRAIVTLEGEVLFADGRIAAGEREQVAAHMLESKRETRELAEIVSKLDVQVSELVAHHQSVRAQIAETGAALDAARQSEHRGELALVHAEKDLRSVEQDLERSQRRLEQVKTETVDLAQQMQEAESEHAGARAELEAATLEKSNVDRDAEIAQSDEAAQRSELESYRHAVTDKKVTAARAKEKTVALEGALERLSRSAQELLEREGRLNDELVAGAKRQGELAGQLFVDKEKLHAAIDGAHARKEELAQARDAHEASRAVMLAHEGDLKTLRHDAETAEHSRMEHEMKVRELAIELQHLLEGVRDRFRGLDLARVVGDYHLRELPGEEHKARMQELAGLIDRLGAVNLDAKREHEEALARHTTYTTQKADLDKALADLVKAIEQMDRESRRLFRDTFEAVNEKFKTIFPQMFRGGRAHLVMTNPDDMLETGIDIVAQPPGKKIGNIELLSGGEKALTAVSLIFAMFQIRPSPFCILDEVDAPLDEANVARYNEAIRTMTQSHPACAAGRGSQFILITHIKRTMQMVDVLYGVTMPEPGISALTSVDLTTIDKKKSALPPRSEAPVAVA